MFFSDRIIGFPQRCRQYKRPRNARRKNRADNENSFRVRGIFPDFMDYAASGVIPVLTIKPLKTGALLCNFSFWLILLSI